MADQTGDMAVVECNSQKIAIRRPVNGKNFLVAANHFVDITMQNEHANPVPDWYHSNERYETVNEALSKDEIVYSVRDWSSLAFFTGSGFAGADNTFFRDIFKKT